MRLILVLVLIVAAGAIAGVLAGKAVAGGSRAPQSLAVPGAREIGLPSEGPVQEPHTPLTNESSGLSRGAKSSDQSKHAGRQASYSNKALSPVSVESSSNGAPLQAREVVFAGETLTDVTVRSMTSPISSIPESSLPFSPSTAATSAFQAVQASREVPSDISVLLVPLGDVNLDGVVGFDDLFLVARSLGTVPSDVPFPLLDMNGDGVVDVSDMAIVAANLGDRFP